jgi:hypothetical protein
VAGPSRARAAGATSVAGSAASTRIPPRASLVLLAVLAAHPFPEERLLLDRRLETLRRILPDGPNPPADRALVADLAQSTGLESLDVQPRPPFDSRSAWADVVVDLSGVGGYDEIDRFFRQVALSPRLIDVESLTLSPAPGDAVHLVAVLRLPYRPEAAPLPAPPEGVRAQVAGVPRPQADAYLRDQALALAKADTIATLRRTRRNPRLFLSEAAAVVRGRPMLLSQATLADEFFLRGLAVGEATLRGFESRLERGFFRVAQVLLARQGPCFRFEVRGRSPVVGLDAEIPLPTDSPFSAEQCRSDRDPPGALVLRAPFARRPRRGSLDLRLRDVDWADVFGVLYQLTGEAFLVDADVSGRISLDFPAVELDEALALLQKGGVKLSPGPLRRVSRGRAAAARPPFAAEGPKASAAVKRADVREVLAALAEADPSLASAPRDLPGRISVWARDLPAADLRAAVVDAVGSSGGAEAAPPLGSPAPPRRLNLRPPELSVQEFELAGLVATGGRWNALVYSPAGALYVYRSGDRLADGSVTSVESTDVLLQTEEGPLRVVLPPLGR